MLVPNKNGPKIPADKKMAGFSWRFDGDIAVEMMVPNWLQVGELLEFSQVYGIPSGND